MRIADLAATTEFISLDEKCYGVLDVDMLTPDYKNHHRYRLTYVIRNDRPTPYVQDLTELGRYSVLAIHPMVQLFTLLEHSVGESWEICDQAYNSDRTRAKMRELREKSQAQSIVAEFVRQTDMKNEYVRRNPRTAERIVEDAKRTG